MPAQTELLIAPHYACQSIMALMIMAFSFQHPLSVSDSESLYNPYIPIYLSDIQITSKLLSSSFFSYDVFSISSLNLILDIKKL